MPGLDLHGNPIAGAKVDVWSDNADGFYDVQQPSTQPKWNNRGVFITEADGRYAFAGIKPVSYPIPDDGPVEPYAAEGAKGGLVHDPAIGHLERHFATKMDARIKSDQVRA